MCPRLFQAPEKGEEILRLFCCSLRSSARKTITLTKTADAGCSDDPNEKEDSEYAFCINVCIDMKTKYAEGSSLGQSWAFKTPEKKDSKNQEVVFGSKVCKRRVSKTTTSKQAKR